MRALDASLAGITAGERQLDGAASRLARSGDPAADVDVATEMVNLDLAKVQTQASAAVARVASETLGTLIDTLA